MKKLTFVFGMLLLVMFISCSTPVSSSSDDDEKEPTPVATQEPPKGDNPSGNPEKPEEPWVLAAEGECGIAYIYLPESDESNAAKSLTDFGEPLNNSDVEYELTFEETVVRKENVTDTICIRGQFQGELCHKLNKYKVSVKKNVSATSFYISSKAYTSVAQENKIFYKLVKTNKKWYMSTMLYNPKTGSFVEQAVPQFENDYVAE